MAKSKRERLFDSITNEIKTIKIEPGDVVILKFPEYHMPRDKTRFFVQKCIDKIKTAFPYNNVIALTDGIEMEIVKQWP